MIKLRAAFSSFLNLEKRGLIYQQTAKVIPIQGSVYCGFDPTAPSLHLGNLISLLMLARLTQIGFKPIALIGGATALIGDPSGKEIERTLSDTQIIEKNTESISSQIEKVLNNSLNILNADGKITVVNNRDFYINMNSLDFLRHVGKQFRMSSLINRHHVHTRIHSESGLSYTEFSYQLLQAHDFRVLHEKYGCTLQVGGSDQWGNIVNGCDYIRKLNNVPVYGITVPLLIAKDGKKFGKSEGNSVCLDDKDGIHQYLINQPDDIIEDLLLKMTFIDLDEIKKIMNLHLKQPEKRYAQTQLSLKVQEIIFGSAQEGKFKNLFETDVSKLCDMGQDELDDFLKGNQPKLTDFYPSVIDLILKNEIRSSKSEIKRIIRNGGLYLNGLRVTDENPQTTTIRDYIIIRLGKKEYHVLKVK